MLKEYTKKEIKEILKENKELKKENHAYKLVVSSKRFHYAEKIATVYNQIFPKWTKRRKVFEKTCRTAIKPFQKIKNRKVQKINNKIVKLAKGYKKVIVINSIPWDDKLKQRPHHLAREFRNLGFFVIYFEPSNYTHHFRIIQDGIVTVNSHVFFMQLPQQHKNCYYLLPNTMAMPLEVIKEVKKSGYKIIYEYIDEFHGDISGDLSSQLAIWNKLDKIKPILYVASAKALEKDIKDHFGKKQTVVLAPNAVTIEHFDYQKNQTTTPPTDLAPIVAKNHPIIGFYGALAPWINFDLINGIAKKHKDWELVLLGIDYNGAAKDLDKADNIHNLGPKKYEELSKYTHYFNCAIIPFKHGKIAKATSPVKLFEYMAAGLPTICTRDLRECSGYDYVYMAKNDLEFEKDLAQAIKDYQNDNIRQKLLDQAKKNTWAKRTKDIADKLK